MSYLDDLYARKATLDDQLKKAQDDLKVQKERKKKVKYIRQDLNNVNNNICFLANSVLNQAVLQLESGLGYDTAFSNTCTTLRDKMEKEVQSDTQLSSADDNLRSEISAIAAKIEDIQSQINTTRSSIWQINQDISNEEWRIYWEEQEEQSKS